MERNSEARRGQVLRRAIMASVIAAALAAPAAAEAQGRILRGVVRDSVGQGIVGVQVVLEGGGFRVETGADGRFRFQAPVEGDAVLNFRRLGYTPERRLVAATDPDVDLVVQLVAVVNRLAPVVVTGRESLRGNIQGFYRRMDQGQGRFVTAEMIERRQLYTMRDLFRNVPGVRVETRRGRTYVRLRNSTVPPQVYIDGVRMAAGEIDIELLDPQTFLGMEVYSGDASTPPEFNQVNMSGQRGGAIIIWTQEGRVQPRQPRRRRSDPSPASVVAAMVERREAYTEEQVDFPARPDPTLPITPIYPDSLYSAGVTGWALAEFVVAPDGQVMRETLDVVTASNPLFADAARRALVAARFFPATLSGRRVAQVVQLPIRFTLPERPTQNR